VGLINNNKKAITRTEQIANTVRIRQLKEKDSQDTHSKKKAVKGYFSFLESNAVLREHRKDNL
jgi:hypothetical protein